jgi:asparaginyl-tRNA synthetase
MPTTDLSHLLHLREAAVHGVRDAYRAAGLREVTVPVLVGITGACENVSTLYRIAADAPLHLTQTGQLALEHALEVVKGVYCVTPSFRTDHIDHRHLNEFTLIEEEICCDNPLIGMSVTNYDPARMFEALLDRITDAMASIFRAVLTEAAEPLAALGGDLDALADVAAGEFYRVSYTEALDLIRSAGGPDLVWGSDLMPTSERVLLRAVETEFGRGPRPTFVTHYPQHIKFFNMKEDDENPAVVQSADLLLPGVGEAVGSAVREHRYLKLRSRLTGSTMFAHITEQGLATLADFEPYLRIIEEGRTSPHAGYGIGLERVLQYLLRSNDIRTCSVPYDLSDRMGFTKVLATAQLGARSPGF